ncbi:Uu.00g070550.m01.CDS01 [Anthostomella pinea]|uniref:Uu.00g070550.m01.CDS01 n=1 Tax=Anthostomella pinea TaxID=933095 RepID=A0AAI8VVK1_9PEZI|nr:Uu.00g070550.m01.CDS01 [Anthostomella pinea]
MVAKATYDSARTRRQSNLAGWKSPSTVFDAILSTLFCAELPPRRKDSGKEPRHHKIKFRRKHSPKEEKGCQAGDNQPANGVTHQERGTLRCKEKPCLREGNDLAIRSREHCRERSTAKKPEVATSGNENGKKTQGHGDGYSSLDGHKDKQSLDKESEKSRDKLSLAKGKGNGIGRSKGKDKNNNLGKDNNRDKSFLSTKQEPREHCKHQEESKPESTTGDDPDSLKGSHNPMPGAPTSDTKWKIERVKDGFHAQAPGRTGRYRELRDTEWFRVPKPPDEASSWKYKKLASGWLAGSPGRTDRVRNFGDDTWSRAAQCGESQA